MIAPNPLHNRQSEESAPTYDHVLAETIDRILGKVEKIALDAGLPLTFTFRSDPNHPSGFCVVPQFDPACKPLLGPLFTGPDVTPAITTWARNLSQQLRQLTSDLANSVDLKFETVTPRPKPEGAS